MASENETLADIVAEMRKRKDMLANAAHSSPLCYSVDTMSAQAELLDEFTDRLDAAAKRERESLLSKQRENVNSGSAVYTGDNKGGNAAAMREALENAHSLICEGIETEADDEIAHPFHLELACEVIQKALAAPPRNCDVGTAEEQAERQHRFCVAHQCGPGCPAWRDGQAHNGCVLAWAQMPYEAEEGGAAQ